MGTTPIIIPPPFRCVPQCFSDFSIYPQITRLLDTKLSSGWELHNSRHPLHLAGRLLYNQNKTLARTLSGSDPGCRTNHSQIKPALLNASEACERSFIHQLIFHSSNFRYFYNYNTVINKRKRITCARVSSSAFSADHGVLFRRVGGSEFRGRF